MAAQAVSLWDIVDSVRVSAEGNPGQQLELLAGRLAQLAPEQLEAFEQQVDAALEEANTFDLWAAANIINGGASDDGFLYFRGWLVMQGREVFARAVADAQSLANTPELVSDDCECEDILYLPARIYESKTGREMQRTSAVNETKGQSWWEDELELRYPRLWTAFGDVSDESAYVGGTLIEIDGLRVRDSGEMHAEIVRQLDGNPSFPHYYGRNSSALHDILTGMLFTPVKFRLVNASHLRENSPALFREILEIIAAARGKFASMNAGDKFSYEEFEGSRL